jgi:hypothetical protein
MVPAACYGVIGTGYAWRRRPEPEFTAAIRDALGDARLAPRRGGGGSYEPTDLDVIAVEPIASMRVQRPTG